MSVMSVAGDPGASRFPPAARGKARLSLPWSLRAWRGDERELFGLPVAVRRRRYRDEDCARLWGAHEEAVRRLAHTLLPQRLDPEDAVIETFAKAVNSLPHLMRTPRPSERAWRIERAWLKRTCINLCIDRHRRRQLEAPFDSVCEPVESEDDPELVMALWHEIENLPPEQWALVKLVHGGYSITEIARLARKPRTTFDSRFRKACENLCEGLTDALDDPSHPRKDPDYAP